MRQKSYDGTPTLYIVPTPIGNMEDITIRALNILKSSDVIFAEDTRETLNLLKYYDIEVPKLIASHKFNENNNVEKVINYLKEEKKVSLVSDRGTPGISDPGYALIKEVIKEGFNVVCLPGATAFVPAMVMSGFSTDRFLFYGFLNSKSSKQKKELESLKQVTYPIIFYEGPHRILDTLNNIKEVLGSVKVVVAREISKKFEEIIRDNIDNVIPIAHTLKGEMVIIVENLPKEEIDISYEQHVKMYIDLGYDSKEAIKMVAKERNVPKSTVYNAYHKNSSSNH